MNTTENSVRSRSAPFKAILSTIAVVTLVGIFALISRRTPKPEGIRDSAHTQALIGNGPVVVATSVEKSIVITNRLDWRQVESADYRAYISNLRSISCPEKTIHDIVVADVNQLFKSKAKPLAEILKKANTYKFWSPPHAGIKTEERAIAEKELVALEQQRKWVLDELLGKGWEDETGFALTNLLLPESELPFSFLPTEKRLWLQTSVKEFHDGIKKAFPGGTLEAADLKRLNAMQGEFDAMLKQNLTPGEYEEYLLRRSPTASKLLTRLDSFQPTESEFREIFKRQRELDEKSGAGGDDQGNLLSSTEAQVKMKQQLREVLGVERYAQYERSMDLDYTQMRRFTQSQGHGDQTADALYDIKREVEQNALRLKLERPEGDNQRLQSLIALQAEARRRVEGILGPDAQKFLGNQYGGIGWLRNLTGSELISSPVETSKTFIPK